MKCQKMFSKNALIVLRMRAAEACLKIGCVNFYLAFDRRDMRMFYLIRFN